MRNTENSLFYYYKKLGITADECEEYKTVKFSLCEKNYTVHITKKSANKATHVHCKENGTVYWEQLYPFGGLSTPRREERVLIKPKREKDETVIVVIKGKPGIITGLDEGIFVSSRGKERTEEDIFVMTEAAFKRFCI